MKSKHLGLLRSSRGHSFAPKAKSRGLGPASSGGARFGGARSRDGCLTRPARQGRRESPPRHLAWRAAAREQSCRERRESETRRGAACGEHLKRRSRLISTSYAAVTGVQIVAYTRWLKLRLFVWPGATPGAGDVSDRFPKSASEAKFRFAIIYYY